MAEPQEQGSRRRRARRARRAQAPAAAGAVFDPERRARHGAAGVRTPFVMGVLNITPDSFSDGGRFLDADAAIARGFELAAQGADIIDVGGESTKPGAAPVAEEEERQRVLPVVEALAAAGLAVSIDTIHAETARAAVAAGASIINDVSGGLHDPAMLGVAAETGATYIAMHWRGIPDPQHRRSAYADVVEEVRAELAALADAALAAGIAPERLVLDPGLGFDKTAEQGWQLLAGLPALAELGYPLLIGVSRKRMIGETLASAGLPADAAQDRDLATAVVSALAAAPGAAAWAVRVHEPAPTVQALAVAAAWEAGRRSLAAFGWVPGPESDGETGPVEPRAAGGAPAPGSANAPDRIAPDRIALTGIEVFAHHGVFDFERERGQRFVVDIELALGLAAAAGGDDLARTVNYAELAEAVATAVADDPVALIETVAERAAGVALDLAVRTGAAAEARVTVHKPEAPISVPFGDVSVTVLRRRAASPNPADWPRHPLLPPGGTERPE